MSKYITLPQEKIDEYTEALMEVVTKAKTTDGKISVSINMDDINRHATIKFTPEAYAKMLSLIASFSDEVAWHGVTKRLGDDDDDIYLIEDILVYPQEVTGATVTTDQEKYEIWLDELDDDTFNNLKMQGHSHVNMGTSPSSTDLDGEEQILSQLNKDMFYIFMIWNKKLEHTIKIYDMKKNILFLDKDIEVDYLIDFMDNAHDIVAKKSYSTYTYSSGKSTSTNTVDDKKETKDTKTTTKKETKKDKKRNSNVKASKCAGLNKDDIDIEELYADDWDDWDDWADYINYYEEREYGRYPRHRYGYGGYDW